MKLKEIIKLLTVVILLIILMILVTRTVKIFRDEGYTGASVENKEEEERDHVKIGFALGTLKEERWIKDRDIVMAKVKEYGGEIIVQNANNDDQDQLKQVKYLLDQDIDVLIIVPNDLEKASLAVEQAKRRGVKVVSYDRLVLNSNVDLYISFDNVRVGEIMANHVLNHVPQGNILIINGPPTDNNTKQIKEGYDSVLKDKIESREIEVLVEEWAPNWMKEYAFSITDQLLQDQVQIDGIIAGNDGLADGVIAALSEHRLAGEVIVVGQDADLVACQRIVEGSQLMTVYKPIEKLADVTAQMAIKLGKGEDLEIVKRISDGNYEIPYYVLDPIAVDQSNIDETIIKDGFHRADEVYRSLN